MNDRQRPDRNRQDLDGPEAVLEAYPLPRRGVLTVAAVMGMLFVAGVSAQWWPTDDSALYLSLGRSIADSGRYDMNGRPCTDVTPGLPLILAGLRAAFGPSMVVANLVMVAFALAALLLAYRIVAGLGGRHLALATIVCVAFSYKYFRHSQLVLTEAPSMLLTAGILACYYSRRLPRAVAAALLVVLAAVLMTVRVPMVGLLILIAVGIGLDGPSRGSRGARALAAGAMAVGAAATTVWFYYLSRRVAERTPLYIASVMRGPGGGQVLGRFVAALEGLGLGLPNALVEFLTSQDGLPMALTVGLVASVLMIAGMVRQWRRGNRMMPFVAIVYPVMLAAGLGAWAVRSRYLAEIHFIFVFLVLDGLLAVAARLWRERLSPERLYRVVLAACVVIVAANAPRLAWRWYQGAVLSRTGGFYACVDNGRHEGLDEVASILRAEVGPGETIATAPELVRIVHWVSGRIATPMPDPLATAEDGRTVADWAMQPDRPFRLLVLAEDIGTEAFRQALLARLQSAGATATHHGEFVICRIPGPATLPGKSGSPVFGAADL